MAALTNQTIAGPARAEVVLVQPIHGLLGNWAAIPAAEN
jgi:hypothetical protein